LFGTDYPQLRTFSTLYAAFGLWLLLWIASELMRPAVWLFVGLTLTLDPVYFHTARVGFLEPAVASWITLMVFALLRAERNPLWLCAAQLAFVLAFFTKQGALFALPLLALASLYLLLRVDRRPKALWIVVGCALFLLVASGVYIASSDYARAVEHNVNHVLLGSDWPTRHQYRGVKTLLYRLRDPERYAHFFGSLPISGLISLATLIGFGAVGLRRRRLPEYRELVVLGWFACAFVAMEVLAKSELRFWTLVVPPAALVMGLGIEHTLRALAQRGVSDRLRHLPLAIPLVALFAWSARGHALYLADPEYTVRDAARALREKIGDRDATVIGFPSPGVVLGTPYKNFYVRGHFNAQREQIRRLNPTHCFLREINDNTREIMEREFPDVLRDLRPELELRVRDENVGLYDIAGRITPNVPIGSR
jgi:4-amino-4-deoxy-L-arabinose transferase-like glycosyltransferase